MTDPFAWCRKLRDDSNLSMSEKALGFILWSYYSPGGDGIFPSIKTLQEKTGATRQGINKWMSALEEAGYVHSKARFRPDGGQTTSIRKLVVPRRNDSGGEGGNRGCVQEDTSKEETTNKNNMCDRVPNDGFSEFWASYPKRLGSNPRKPAMLKYRAALKVASHETIMAGVKRLAKAHPTPSPYIPMAQTWLHQERWNDEPGEPQAQRGVRSVFDGF